MNCSKALVRKFHNSVSAGPVYICTCCDQLWYKHSVSPADRLRLINPDITKYLQSVRSADVLMILSGFVKHVTIT